MRAGESLGAAGRRAELGGPGTRTRGPCCREGRVLVRVAALRRMRRKASRGEERDPSHLWPASCRVAARVSGVSEVSGQVHAVLEQEGGSPVKPPGQAWASVLLTRGCLSPSDSSNDAVVVKTLL